MAPQKKTAGDTLRQFRLAESLIKKRYSARFSAPSWQKPLNVVLSKEPITKKKEQPWPVPWRNFPETKCATTAKFCPFYNLNTKGLIEKETKGLPYEIFRDLRRHRISS